MTHCNAGALAAVGWGTATAPVYMAYEKGLDIHVWVVETRPRNQGASLTAWELDQRGVPYTVIADNTGGHLMQRGYVDICITGTDRTAANGDVANKIGTYALAILARYHNTKFMVVAPTSTLDISAKNGRDIPIEYREAEEITKFNGEWLSRPQASALNPVFDVTPASLVDALVTEKGVILEPTEEKICSLLAK